MNVSERRDQYFRTLNLLDRSGDAAKAALKRAYELRNFEIEHYWKRATYFWAFQVAIFAAFGLLWKEETGTKPGTNPVIVVPAGLGILMALANALSARGSRFWQNNWEKHIDILEDEIDAPRGSSPNRGAQLGRGCTGISAQSRSSPMAERRRTSLDGALGRPTARSGSGTLGVGSRLARQPARYPI
jgi:hypothetical protein